MTFEQIERLAYERAVMPASANLTENKCYEAMACLYSRYRTRAISLENAKIRKKNIRDAYERKARRDRRCDEEARRYRRISYMMTEVEKNGTETERQFIRIMDGRERIIDNDENSEEHSFEQVTMPQV